jgi:hypothetical protein
MKAISLPIGLPHKYPQLPVSMTIISGHLYA